MRHLPPVDGEATFIQQMNAVQDELLIMTILIEVKDSKELVTDVRNSNTVNSLVYDPRDNFATLDRGP